MSASVGVTSARLVIAALLAIATPAMTAGPAAARTEYVLVNANADGDTPVSGGMARLYRCGRDAGAVPARRPLRQRDGSSGERTYRTGEALLEFRRLPRCFVVAVSGGRSDGRRLRGSFVADGRDRPGRLSNVPVTPVSTLVHDVGRSHPRMSDRRALRLVQRRLRIPRYFDQFDGDRYVAAVRRAGGVARLNRELLADTTPPTFRKRGARGHAAQGGIEEWWNSLDITGAALSGIQDFGVSFVWDNVVKAGGKWVLGRFLDYYGLQGAKDLLFPKSDTQKLIEMVERLQKRINDLEATGNEVLKQIAELKSQLAAAPGIVLLTHIDTNQNSMQRLAKLNPADGGVVGATRALMGAIARDQDDRNLLHTVVAGIGGPGLLVQESRRTATKRFFTPRDSQEVRDVYRYYVLYQLRFANLLTEYWNTQSCSQPPGRTVDPDTCLAPAFIKGMIDDFQKDIQAQEKILKPAVPAGHFVDVKKNLMWAANPPWVSGAPYTPPSENCFPVITRRPCPPSDWRNPGFELANKEQFRSLIDRVPEGATNPFDYLQKHAGLVSSAPANTPDSHKGHMWLGSGGLGGYLPVHQIARGYFSGEYQTIERVNLKSEDRPGPHVFLNHLYDLDPQDYYAHAMTRPQPVAPGTYWYP